MRALCLSRGNGYALAYCQPRNRGQSGQAGSTCVDLLYALMMDRRGQLGQQALLGGIAEMLGGVFVRWRPILRRVFFRIEAVGGVQYAHRKLGIILLDQQDRKSVV